MKRTAIFIMVLFSLFFFTIPLSGPEAFEFQIPREYKMINIVGKASGSKMEGMKIEPFDKIYAGRFTKLDWTNNSDVPVRVTFRQGKDCTDKAFIARFQRYWIPQADCLTTKEPIAPRESLWITFNEPGSYHFEIEFLGTESKINGEIKLY